MTVETQELATPAEVAELQEPAGGQSASEAGGGAGAGAGAGAGIVAKLRAAAARAGSTGQVDDLELFHRQLRHAARRPSRALADTIHSLLEDEQLRGLSVDGEPTADVLVEALVSMGFPYALEVSPEHWSARRTRSPRPRTAQVTAHLTLAVATLSVLYHLWFLVVFFRGHGNVIMVPFVVGLVHGLIALFAALSKNKHLTVFRGLAWAGLIGPIAGVACALAMGVFGLIAALVCASPAMLTAVSALVTARRVEAALQQPNRSS